MVLSASRARAVSFAVFAIPMMASFAVERGAYADEATPPVARPAAPSAESATPPKPRTSADRPWKITTGFGFGAIVGGVGGPAVVGAPGGYLTGERRLVGPLWLMGRLGADYIRSSSAPYNHSSEAGIGGSLGLRVAFTSPETLEVSAFALVGGSYAVDEQSSSSPLGSSSHSQSRSFGGQLGIALDREIVPGFGLRVSTAIARASTAHISTRYESPMAPPSRQSASQTDVALMLAPSLELRWSF